jgi:hypothetical protein
VFFIKHIVLIFAFGYISFGLGPKFFNIKTPF